MASGQALGKLAFDCGGHHLICHGINLIALLELFKHAHAASVKVMPYCPSGETALLRIPWSLHQPPR